MMKKATVCALVFLGFYALVLYGRSGVWFEVEIEALDRGATPATHLYWTRVGEPLSEEKSARPETVKNGRYVFKLPPMDRYDTIRFDPAVQSGRRLAVKRMRLKVRRGLMAYVYDLNLTDLKPLAQIENARLSGGSYRFETTGSDPQLIFPFKPKMVSSRYVVSLPELLWALFATLLTCFIFRIAKTPDANEKTAKNILYAVFLFFIVFKAVYYQHHVRPGYPPDELAHYRYVEFIKNDSSFVPDFSKMPDYLSHPPLYYQLCTLCEDSRLGTRENIVKIRAFSVALFALTVLLTLYIGYRSGLGILGHFVYLSLLASIPMYAYIGGSLSNDVLALFGGIVFLLGFQRLIEERYDWSTVLLLGVGAYLSYFSKLTAALLVFFAMFFYLVYLWRYKLRLRLKKRHWAVLTLLLIPILWYQVDVMMRYHALVPLYSVTHPQAYLHSPFYVPPQQRVHLGLDQWFLRLMHYILGGWFGIHSHHSFGHGNWSGVWGLVVLHIMAVAALFMPCRGEKSFCLTGKFALFGLFAVLTVQFFFSYRAHLRQGYLGGLQPRYVMPFVVGFAVGASMFADRFKKRFWWQVAVIAICVHALYADFFYFLLYCR